MLLTMMKAKLHKGRLTGTHLHYEGSITVDPDLLEAAGILVHEQVDVLDINNGARFTTYTIEGQRGSREICVNGAAARLVSEGDEIIIVAYAQMDAEEAKTHEPTVVQLDPNNQIKA